MKNIFHNTDTFTIGFKRLMTAAITAQQIFNLSLNRPKPYEPLSQVTIVNYAEKLTIAALFIIPEYFSQSAANQFQISTMGYGVCGHLGEIAQISGIPENHWDNLYLNRVFPSGLFIVVYRNGEVWLEDKAREIRNEEGELINQTWINANNTDLTTLINVCLFLANSGSLKIIEVLSHLQNPVAQYFHKIFNSQNN